jgi:hypothetical protein
VSSREVEEQLSLRASERLIGGSIQRSCESIPSKQLEQFADNMRDYSRAVEGFGIAAGAAAVREAERRNPRGAALAGAAAVAAQGAAFIGKLVEDLARAEAAKARAREGQARQAEARAKHEARQIRDAVDRGMRQHRERMSRGEYRDPPTRERMADISRMC